MQENNNEQLGVGKYIFFIIIVIIILGVIYFYSGKKEPENNIENNSGNLVMSDKTLASENKEAMIGQEASTTTDKIIKNNMHTITIETNKGKIVFETYDSDAPKTSKNFVDLANKGFYNGVIFHRVIKGFMIQGGDPTGTGMGGPGYKFEDELNPDTESYKMGYVRGTVAMANAGPNTNGSQFFIMHKDTPLPHNYTIFGHVIEGMDVVDKIANEKVDQVNKPLEKVVMNEVTVKENQ